MAKIEDFADLKLATRHDKPIILDIILKAFVKDPGLLWMLEMSKNPKKLQVVTEFLIDEVFNTGFIYLAKDNSGVALWSTNKKERFSYHFIKRNIRVLFSLRFSTVLRLLKFQNFTHSQFPSNHEYIYLANIAVLPEAQGQGIASKLMNPILEKYSNEQIPIYLETANTNNVNIYKRKGFCITEIKNFGDVIFYYMNKRN